MPFTGGVIELPAGTGGYNANANISTLLPDELIQSNNTSYAFGTLQKEGGSAMYTPSSLGANIVILGGHDWFPNLDTTQRSIIVCNDNTVRRDTGAGTYSTTLATLPNLPDSTPVFVEGGRESSANNRKLFTYTGTNQIQTLSGDGTSIANIANPPTDLTTHFAIGGCIHLNRHFAFGGVNPHYIYGSDQLDHEDFGASFTFTGNVSTTTPNVISGVTIPALLKLNNNISGTFVPPGTLVAGFGSGTVTLNTPIQVPAVSATVSAAGSGYSVGDHLTIVGGTGTEPTWAVATLSGTGVATVTLVSAGALSVTPANPAATTNQTGTGSGCTLTITYPSLTGITFTSFNPNAVNLPIYPGVGEKIIAIFSFKGMLIVAKYPRGLYYVDMQDPLIINWFTVELSQEIGFAGPLAWCPVDDDILFMDPQGNTHMLSTVLEFGDYGLRSVSDIAWMRNFIIANVAFQFIANVQAIFYLAKREAHFTLTGIGSTTNSIRMVVDFNRQDKIRFRYADKDSLASLWLARDINGTPRITGGDAKGVVWTLDQVNNSTNGIGYNSPFQTAHLDFSHINPGLAAKRKNFKFLELIGEAEGNWSINVDVYLDGQYTQTTQFNLGANAVGLGTFVLGTNTLAGGLVLASRRRLYGSGKRISLVGNVGGANQDYSIAKIIFSYSVAGESDDH